MTTMSLMAKKKSTSVFDVLRDAIHRDGRSVYAISKAAGIAPIVLSRFINKDRTISVATIEKLARVLGLSLRLD
jgi:plasmid maintenance system antidote protein VapI